MKDRMKDVREWIERFHNSGRHIQSIGITIYLDRDCWRWGTDRHKGGLYLYAGPVSVEIEQ